MKRPKPRIFQGFRDIFSADLLVKQRVLDTIRKVYERYGFIPLETPAVEFVDCLGKFLPESSTPQGGIFSFRNPDAKGADADNENGWLAMRYDLTAPLARVVAQYQDLQKPFRRYQVGPVWRHEKPGPGRFREFYQFDFDCVGTSSMAADTEACCIICEALEAIGFKRSEYLIKVNNRKILQGILEICGLKDCTNLQEDSTSLIVLRAIDKLDRLGWDGVHDLLGNGRKDASGDFTIGAHLAQDKIDLIHSYLTIARDNRENVCNELEKLVVSSKIGMEGVQELQKIDQLLNALGYGVDRVVFDPTIVRGMSYYTGPVFEGVLTTQVQDENGQTYEFGSVFGGGRYDGLIERFTGQKVAATGASIGVDRLLAAMKILGKAENRSATSDVLVTVMDKKRMADYLKIAQLIRNAGFNAEVFMGNGGIGQQMKYADKLGIPIALIAGSNEFERGEYQLKDLQLGMELSKDVADRETWKKERPAQQSVPQNQLIEKLKEMLK
jgi:histidyl-tRNA synthetase